MATVMTDLFGAIETLISGDATFQANTGAADATEALDYIVSSFTRGREAIQEKPTIAIIMLAEGEGVQFSPVGDGNNLPAFSVEVEIYDIDRKPGDADLSEKTFADFVYDVMKTVSDAADTNTYPIKNVRLIGFERTHDVIENAGLAYWVGAFSVEVAAIA